MSTIVKVRGERSFEQTLETLKSSRGTGEIKRKDGAVNFSIHGFDFRLSDKGFIHVFGNRQHAALEALMDTLTT